MNPHAYQQSATARCDAEHDPIHLAAADWLARLQQPTVSLEDTLAWQNWMRSDARHVEAFTRMEQTAAVLRVAASPARPRASDVARDRYDASVPLSDWQRSAKRNRFFTRSFMSLAACFLITAIVAAAIVANGDWPAALRAPAPNFATNVGEVRRFALADGSVVTLGGSSEIEAHMGSDARRVELLRGEAFFTIVKDATRPFTVRAGATDVTALGTAFNVRRGGERVVVSVMEGRVRVEPRTHLLPVAWLRNLRPKLEPIDLTAGQQTIALDGEIEAAIEIPDTAAATSWQSGRLAFRLEPLKYVLADVNRYVAKPIELAEDDIGDMTITGTVVDSNVPGWIASLEAAFGLEAVEEPDRILLKKSQR